MKVALVLIATMLPSFALAQGQQSLTCTEREGACKRMLSQAGPEWGAKCKQAGDQCRKSGRFVAPYSGTVFDNVPRK